MFEYDEQHRISKRYRYDNEVLIEILILTYSGNLVTISENRDYNTYPIFRKDGDTISFNYQGGSEEIKVNAKGLPLKHTIRWRGIMTSGQGTTIYT